MAEFGDTLGAVHRSLPAPAEVPSTPVATVYSSVMFWFEPVMNLISMLFHDWLVVVSHWIKSGEPSSVVLGVRGEGAVDAVDDVDWRLAWRGTAATDETLVKASMAQGARAASENFMLTRVSKVEWRYS